MRRGLILLAAVAVCNADFFYRDFNETSGLRYNGVATTTSCDDGGPYAYNPAHGGNDPSDEGEAEPIVHEAVGTLTESTVQTFSDASNADTTVYRAGVPHRDQSAMSQDPIGCPLRLRLTPARPNRRGSVMRLEAAPVLNGFETGFAFQVTDHSLSCSLVKDPSFSVQSHKSCSVHGGDGFAWVLHNDPNTTAALGIGGSGIGFEGMRNALVLKFDTWYNPGEEAGDLYYDHVALQASPSGRGDSAEGMLGPAWVTAGRGSRLGRAMRAAVADGAVHRVRITYFRYLKYDLVPYFTASTNLLQYIADGGEGRRVGTLAVWLDDLGPGAVPLLAMPLNLDVLLQLPEGEAFMGFTASTGKAWEKHDILEWYFCQTPGCGVLRGGGFGGVGGLATDAADYAGSDAVDAAANAQDWLRYYV